MSNRKKLVQKPQNVVTAPTLPAEPQPTVVTEETTPEQVKPENNVPATEPAAAEGKHRTQTSKEVNITISSARVRRYLDKDGINRALDKEKKLLKEKIAVYLQAKKELKTGKKIVEITTVKPGKPTKKDPEPKPVEIKERKRVDLTPEDISAAEAIIKAQAPIAEPVEKQLLALSHARTRFSNEAAIVLAIVCDELIRELAKHAIGCVLKTPKKTVTIDHIYGEGVEDLSLYKLVKDLPTFVAYKEKVFEKIVNEKIEKAVAAAVYLAEKKIRDENNLKKPPAPKPLPKAENEAQPEAPEAEQPAESDDDEVPSDVADTKATFKHYVAKIYREVATQDQSSHSVRFLAQLKDYLADLLIDFILHVGQMVRLSVELIGNKTVTEKIILYSIEQLLVSDCKVRESVTFTPARIVDPAALEAEKAKKKADPKHKYKKDALPHIDAPGFVAHHTVVYDKCAYPVLEKLIRDKLALYNKSAPAEEKH